jgi:hypothetical protein
MAINYLQANHAHENNDQLKGSIFETGFYLHRKKLRLELEVGGVPHPSRRQLGLLLGVNELLLLLAPSLLVNPAAAASVQPVSRMNWLILFLLFGLN